MPNDSSIAGERIAVFDLDGTITYKDTYVAFLLFCLKKRPLRILRGGELILYFCLFKAGFYSNHWLKAKYLRTVVGGIGGAEFEGLCGEFSAVTLERNIKPNALSELVHLKAQGYIVVLATASFGFYVERLFAELEMDYLLCSHAQLDPNGGVTGAIEGNNCIGEEKARRLQQLCAAQNWNNIERAYSDDLVDLPMFNLANSAFVVDPSPSTAARAEELGIPVLNWR